MDTAEARAVPEQEWSSREEALDYLMRRYGQEVMKLAYYHVRDRYLAEDIMQDTFCRVYQKMDGFRKDSSYYTWIFQIAVNLCRDHRKSAYRRRVGLKDMGERRGDGDAALFQAGEGGGVFARVMDLPEKYRTVVALFYFEDMTTGRIAQVLGLRENAVRTRLSRAREKLRGLLEGLANE